MEVATTTASTVATVLETGRTVAGPLPPRANCPDLRDGCTCILWEGGPPTLTEFPLKCDCDHWIEAKDVP